jgi:hypothetical protein
MRWDDLGSSSLAGFRSAAATAEHQPLLRSYLFGEAVLMMELPRRHSTPPGGGRLAPIKSSAYCAHYGGRPLTGPRPDDLSAPIVPRSLCAKYCAGDLPGRLTIDGLSGLFMSVTMHSFTCSDRSAKLLPLAGPMGIRSHGIRG